MEWLKWADDFKTWGGGIVVGFGGLIVRWRANRRSELEVLVNELQEECKRKGIENEQLNTLVTRLHRTTNYQRMEIFLHNRNKSEALEELHVALEKVRTNADDCFAYITRAVRKLQENVIIPNDEDSKQN